MTDLSKLRAEAEERAVEEFEFHDEASVNRISLHKAIAAYHAHIAAALREEDERKEFEDFTDKYSTMKSLGERTTESFIGYSELELWQAALRRCPYRRVICGDGVKLVGKVKQTDQPR